jgi:hypothetical protein
VTAVEAVPKKPLLERVGVTYFERRSARTEKIESGDAVHILNPLERKALRAVTRGCVVRAGVAGALSSVASAVAELIAEGTVGDNVPEAARSIVAWWMIVMGVTIIASIFEIAFLYWDGLRSVHELGRQAGLKLFETKGPDTVMVATVLARAALELPNPVENRWGINPRREAAKWRLVAASLLYKAKIGLTNFLFKALVRRMLGRVLLRRALQTAVPFVAVPVTAAWNSYVAWRVMREARLRAMGPSAIHELVGLIFSDHPQVEESGRIAALRAVGAAIVRTQDLHPNLLALFDEVASRAKYEGTAELDDPGEFLRSLSELSKDDRRLALQVLAIALIVDGELAPKEKLLYREALASAGREVDLTTLETLRRAFVRGDGWADEAIRAL